MLRAEPRSEHERIRTGARYVTSPTWARQSTHVEDVGRVVDVAVGILETELNHVQKTP
jgi:hypothetical protein